MDRRLPNPLRALFPGSDGGSGRETPAFVELKHGIFTASGTWFHTTKADLELYAAELLARVPLERLLPQAESVLRAPTTAALWTLLGLLALTAPIPAVLASLVVFLAWSVVSPGLVTLWLVRIYRVLDSVPLQGVVYVVVLSLLANQGRPEATWTGLAGFVLLRWGVVERILGWPATLLRRSLYRLDLPDQVLRAVIVRHALALGASVAQLDAMERRMLDFAARRGAARPKDPT